MDYEDLDTLIDKWWDAQESAGAPEAEKELLARLGADPDGIMAARQFWASVLRVGVPLPPRVLAEVGFMTGVSWEKERSARVGESKWLRADLMTVEELLRSLDPADEVGKRSLTARRDALLRQLQGDGE